MSSVMLNHKSQSIWCSIETKNQKAHILFTGFGKYRNDASDNYPLLQIIIHFKRIHGQIYKFESATPIWLYLVFRRVNRCSVLTQIDRFFRNCRETE